MRDQYIRLSGITLMVIVGLLSPQHFVFAEEGTSVAPPPQTAPSDTLPPSHIPPQPPMPGNQPNMFSPQHDESRQGQQFGQPPMPMQGKPMFNAPQGNDPRQFSGQPQMKPGMGQDSTGARMPMMQEGGNDQSAEMDKKREQQQVRGMQSRMRGMEQVVRSYKTQIERLKKQGVTIPTSIAENLAQLEIIITAIKNAKTMEEMEAAGMEQMQELMQEIDEQRGILERLSRWGQTIKQIDRALVNVKKQLARDQKLVAKLQKQQIDISHVVAVFESGVNEMVSVRNQAVELVKTDPEAAFDLIEEGIFEQMEELMQHDRVIQSMANLGQFTSQFKRRIAEADHTITQLKRKKVDTSTLEKIIAEIKVKGAELQGIIKDKEVDPQSIADIMEEFEQLTHEFEQAREEAMGGSDERMPWEQGGQQSFRPMTFQFSQLFPVKKNA